MGARRYGNARDVRRYTAFQGIPIAVEIEAGEHYVGDGWEQTYEIPYGEIPDSVALSDGDGVDVYLGPNPAGDTVYVVHQNRRDGTYDEDKVMFGFDSERDAVRAYLRHGPEWGFGSVDSMTVSEFKNGYLASNRAEMARPGGQHQ